jgi:TfoX C-terminal domain
MIKRPKRFHKPSARVRDGGSNLAALAALPSLGRTSAQMLIEVGIPDKAMLRRLGPQACFRALRFRFGAARLDEFHLCA